jgi:hypothetical protein
MVSQSAVITENSTVNQLLAKPLGDQVVSPFAIADVYSGVLSIQLRVSLDPVEAEFDENELFIFRSTYDNSVQAFEIPFFEQYWQYHLDELGCILDSYAPKSSLALWFSQNAQMSNFEILEAAE